MNARRSFPLFLFDTKIFQIKRSNDNSNNNKQNKATMSEPDELYTLRAQYWLGHYQLALEEAKTIARRPMSAELKDEREEFIQRCQLALGVPGATDGDTPGT